MTNGKLVAPLWISTSVSSFVIMETPRREAGRGSSFTNDCPAEGALAMSLAGRKRTEPIAIAAGILLIFAGVVGYAKMSRHWDSPIPQTVYDKFIPIAAELDHPR